MTNDHSWHNRANVLVRYTNKGKPILVYEDHRYLLNILSLAKLRGDFKFPINLIRFDKHFDACELQAHVWSTIEKFQRNGFDIRDFFSFTEFDLNPLDDDWLRAGMELGLVQDTLIFQAEVGDNIEPVYIDKTGGEHRSFEVSSLWGALSHQGALTDIIKEREHFDLWEFLGWHYHKDSGRFFFPKEVKKPFVLDIDLDCFSMEILEKTVAIPRKRLLRKLNEYHNNGSASQFIRELIERCEFVTICMESDYCGGMAESHKILKVMDDLFFDGNILSSDGW